MRSASAVSLVVTLGMLGGCTTTQQKAARLRVNSARLRVTQLPTHIPRPDPKVRVAGVSLVRQGRTTMLVATVKNLTGRAVSDLPILAGYRLAHRRRPVYLNSGAGLDYFESHLPAVAPHGSLRWVLSSVRRVPGRARPFAEVGDAVSVKSASPTPDLPRVVVQQLGPVSHGRVRVKVINESAIPQYQLQLYAVSTRGSRAVAAGRAALDELGAGATKPMTMTLIGSSTSGQVTLEAPPTIFS